MSIERAALLLHAGDDVAVAREDIPTAAVVRLRQDLTVTARDAVASGHKLAVHDIAAGAPVHKYGQVIGVATQPIAAGSHVHDHNLGMTEDLPVPQLATGRPAAPAGTAADPSLVFDGYLRSDGRVGTRNYLGVIASVNCSATVCKGIVKPFEGEAIADWPGVDGVVALTHSGGCGMSGEGEGLELLQRTLRGYAAHPNFAGVLVVGLGCEVNQVDALVDGLVPTARERVRTLSIQQAGGTREAIEEGRAIVRAMLRDAGAARRSPQPVKHLCVGLQCGGSDGYSGISANPALGAAVDLLVRHGGTAILSETPEVHGAEHLLTARARHPAVAERLLERLQWWEQYTARNGSKMDNNPSPGNKAGGITTILEKSLGAVAKGGTTALNEVVGYAEPVRETGLVFMDTPGYDPVSATGQVAGGANLICFTTGRGSVYGCKPVPSLKLATNSAMYRRMSLDMDVNCGEILDGNLSVAQAGERIFALMLETASGRRSLSEQHGLGDNEFVPWPLGAVL